MHFSFKKNVLSLFTAKLTVFSSKLGGSRLRSKEDLELGHDPNCPFCDVRKETGFNIVLEEGGIVVFHDRDPAAQEHLQVVPIKHQSLNSVKDLRASHIPLLREMEKIGHQALDMLPSQIPFGNRVLGFHIPPFTSISHLHMHVHGLPYKTMRRYKYPVVSGPGRYSKGRSYFVTISQAIEILENGSTVSLATC